MIKTDLHTHSIISPDGGIRAAEYKKILQNNILDCIAITDHNQLDFALQQNAQFGDKIIVGEEITTTEGEMIGLFLKTLVSSGMSARKTAEAIRAQGGLVYIPHPFETIRQGIQEHILETIVESIDIIEVFNGRGRWRGKAAKALAFAQKHAIAQAASSDAHGYHGLGRTYTYLEKIPTKDTMKALLKKGKLEKTYAPLWTFLYPSLNKIKNKLS
jgi:predicted metal-dependent phosphoesterase TrpH